MAHLTAPKIYAAFPQVNDKVKLYDVHTSDDLPSIILCEKSRMVVANEDIHLIEYDFWLKLIREHGLGFNDMKKIMQTACKVKETLGKFLTDVHGVISYFLNEYRVLRSFNKNILCENTDIGQICDNNLLRNFAIITVSDCKYADSVSVENKRNPYWSVGCHSKKRSGEFLIGFLYICPGDGVLVLSDSKHKMLLILTGHINRKETRALINKVVFLRTYTIFTEVFKEPIGNVECILCHTYEIKSLEDLSKERSCKQHIFEELPVGVTFPYRIKFLLRNKTSVSKTHKLFYNVD